MGLKCKLPRSVPEDIFNHTVEKLVGSGSGSSGSGSLLSRLGLFSSSQLLIVVSFFGLIGLIILWLSQPTSSEESQSDNEKELGDASSSSRDEDETQRLVQNDLYTNTRDYLTARQQQLNQRRRISPPSNGNKYVIDTIYESHNEIYEEKTTSVSINYDYKVSSENVLQRRDEEARKINLDSVSSSLNSQNVTQPAVNLTKSTEDMVDRILDDLVSDEIENYAYNKPHKSLNKQDSISNKNDSSKESSGSTNSLLGLYNAKHVNAIEDRFHSLEEVSNAIKDAGLEKSQLIFGIDFTISNLENGAHTFGGNSLHTYDENIKNPYQKVIEILGKTLECFDVDGKIPAYGFGDADTKDRKVFSFSPTGYCMGFKDVLNRYNEVLKTIVLSGPTNFAPLIKQAIRIVKETKQYHILVIVADGQVTNERQTRDAIVEASKYALSIIMVGVGDGPWETMNEFDDSLPKRQFDNFQFVNYHQVIEGCDNPDEAFALNALMEIPDQFKAIKELNLLKKHK